MNAQITNIKFFIQGNAIFTVSNPQNEHYTFKVSKKPNDEDSPLFVGLLTGPNNEYNYQYIGILDKYQLKLTKKSNITPSSKVLKVFNWTLKQVYFNKRPPKGYSIQHVGKCCKCGRTLTTPESIALGIGPSCRKQSKSWS